jgi:hypothetical protein
MTDCPVERRQTAQPRTYAACDRPKVVEYDTLPTGAISHVGAPGRIRRNMLEPIPVVIRGGWRDRSALCERWSPFLWCTRRIGDQKIIFKPSWTLRGSPKPRPGAEEPFLV